METNENFLVDGQIVIRPITRTLVCRNHDIIYWLLGEKCPYCKRKALTGYDLDE